jgi:hypothetical protein
MTEIPNGALSDESLRSRPASYTLEQIDKAMELAGWVDNQRRRVFAFLQPTPKTAEPLQPRYMIVEWPEPSALMCKDCGAVVIDEAIHGKWHTLQESESRNG